MFKVRMQGQYGSPSDQRLRAVFSQMWSQWGIRKGIMRGYWVKSIYLKTQLRNWPLNKVTVAREIPAYAG